MSGRGIVVGGVEITGFETVDVRFPTSRELDGSDGKTRLTLVQSGFDPTNPPYPGWAGWLSGIAALRRYHELPRWRSIWRQVEAADLPEGMMAIDQ